MAVYEPTRTAWLAVTETGMGQARNGRILWAETNSPDPEDWLVFPEGAVIPVTTGGYVMAVEAHAIFVVAPV